ncbi:MAG TPA: nickel-binding protein [Polyangiaceae bacterium]
MARIVVEYSFEKPMSDEELSVIAQRLDPCLDVRNGTWARSYVAGDRRRMTCEFEAPDAESVREALRSANVTFERVWPANVFDAADYPEFQAKLEKLRGKKG